MSPQKLSNSQVYRGHRRKPVNPPVPPSWAKPRQAKVRWRIPRLLGLGVIMAGVASLSATAGALLAVSLSAPPLHQQPLRQGDGQVFPQDSPITEAGTLR